MKSIPIFEQPGDQKTNEAEKIISNSMGASPSNKKITSKILKKLIDISSSQSSSSDIQFSASEIESFLINELKVSPASASLAAHIISKEAPSILSSIASASLSTEGILITQKDYDYLTQALPAMDRPSGKFLLALALYSRAYPHKSNWIRYNISTLLFLSNISKPQQVIRAMTTYLHDNHGLLLQVVGSKNPIPCFQLSWQVSQSEEDLQQLIKIADELTQQQLTAAYDKIIAEAAPSQPLLF